MPRACYQNVITLEGQGLDENSESLVIMWRGRRCLMWFMRFLLCFLRVAEVRCAVLRGSTRFGAVRTSRNLSIVGLTIQSQQGLEIGISIAFSILRWYLIPLELVLFSYL